MVQTPDGAAGQAAQYEPDHLVVALPHLRAVRAALLHLNGGSVAAHVEDSDERLGLAMLKLTNLQPDAGRLRQNAELMAAVAESRRRLGGSDPADSITDLDLLMFELRRHFAEQYFGWTPTMGKNRRLEAIHGFPEIVGGGKGFPEPVSGDSVRIARPTPGVGPTVRIGIMDTQLYAHPLLQGSYLAAGETILNGDASLPQAAGHATFIAGLILQQAPSVDLDVRACLSEEATATAWQVARKMVQFADSGVEVLNLSWGCRTDDGQGPLVLSRAVELLSPDVVIVAAGGNHPVDSSGHQKVPPRTPTFPAAFNDVVAVGATNDDGSDSGINPDGPWMDLRTAGVNVKSTYLRGKVDVVPESGQKETVEFTGYASWTGTSFAAGNVTGEIAAHVRPGRRSAREVVDAMLNPTDGGPRFRAKPF
jgi:hypothetical protein